MNKTLLILFGLLGGLASPARALDSACAASGRQLLAKLDPVTSNLLHRGSANARSVFDQYVDCRYSDKSVFSATHEAVHILTQDLQGYPLITGEIAPHQQSFPPKPKEILGWIPSTSDDLYRTMIDSYLKSEEGNENLHAMVDELNAYSHNVHVDDLAHAHGLRDQDNGARLSLATMFLFVKLCLQKMKDSYPSSWANFLRSSESQSVAKVLREAMAAHAEACDYDELGGSNDHPIAKAVNSREHSAALSILLNRGGPYLWEDCKLMEDPLEAGATVLYEKSAESTR